MVQYREVVQSLFDDELGLRLQQSPEMFIIRHQHGNRGN